MISRICRILRGAILLWTASLLIAQPLWASRCPLVVTHPCLSSLVAFIGGINISVQPLARWDGVHLVRLHPDIHGLPALALDRREALAYGLNLDSDAVVSLYREFPMDRSLEEVFSDPACLPFLGQRVLVAISDLDPNEYEYYQRRLAEFQSRLDSTVSMGRRILKGAEILTFSKNLEPLFAAAGCTVTLASDEMLASLQAALEPENEVEEDGLIALLEEWTQGVDAVIVDRGIDKKILELIPKLPKWIVVVPLDEDVDLLTALYDRYLAVWNVLRIYQEHKR